MDILNTLPAMIKISGVFILILAAIRMKISLGHSLLGGSIILGFIFGLNPFLILKSAFISLIHPKTLALSCIVMLILVLSHSMEKAGQMARLLDTFKGLIKHTGINLVIFPALIGLLPMPGGAVFSAPMVKNIGNSKNLTGAQLSYINYWFRHVWEYWWPLYPGVLLTTAIADLNLGVYILFMIPLTIVALISGYWPIGYKSLNKDTKGLSENPERPRFFPFFMELLPILIVVVLGLGIGAVFSMVFKKPDFPVAKEAGLIIALIISILWVWSQNRFSMSQRWSILKRRQLFKMFYLVSTILIFKGILEDSHAIKVVSQELIQWSIPLIIVAVILPCLVGVISGISIAFVGTTFPIIISLIQSYGEAHLMLPYMILAMVSGFVGVLISPLHLCILLSNEYFETSLFQVYRHLWLPCAALFSSSCLYFWILKIIMSN